LMSIMRLITAFEPKLVSMSFHMDSISKFKSFFQSWIFIFIYFYHCWCKGTREQ
jgi:hypothetical protein